MSDIVNAERGYVYAWRNLSGDNHYNLCLVVSNSHRRRDKLISILFLSSDNTTRNSDAIGVEVDGINYVVHTDLVTYTQRTYLQEQIAKVPEEKMKEISDGIAESLELNDRIDYESMYNNLLDEVLRSSK